MRIFDSHFHIINPEYPLVANNGYLPPDFTTTDYMAAVNQYDIVGGAVVSGSFQAFDQNYLMDALNKLGKDFYGVANIWADITPEELYLMNEANVVAVRFNVQRGGSEKIEHMESLSNFLYSNYGWHTELYIDSKELKNLRSVLENIPKFSIDHLGMSDAGLNELYYWVERGTKIKATGFGRIDMDPIAVMKTIYNIAPDALMFGTDLPSTRANIPFSGKDLNLVLNNFTESELENILYNNAKIWYQRKTTVG